MPVEIRGIGWVTAPSLALGDLAPSFTGHCSHRAGPTLHSLEWESWPQWHGSRRASSAPYLRGLVSVVQINHLSSHPDPHPGPCAGPSSHLSYLSPAGACEGTGPVKWQLENLHVQDQHQDICGDLWWRSSDGTANIWTMWMALSLSPRGWEHELSCDSLQCWGFHSAYSYFS